MLVSAGRGQVELTALGSRCCEQLIPRCEQGAAQKGATTQPTRVRSRVIALIEFDRVHTATY